MAAKIASAVRRVGLAGRGLIGAGFWEALQKALKFATSPPQRLRLRLTLAARLQAAGRTGELIANYQALLAEQPDYPARPEIEKKLKNLEVK